jgi:hypothetical protein
VNSSPPTLLVRLDLKQPPISLVLAGSWEDEQRIRFALTRPATRRRVLAAFAAALDDLAEGRRAA